MSKTYYDILGIDPHASDGDIREAYRYLAKQFHPDKSVGVNKAVQALIVEKFREIQEAYDVLKDVDKRREYDQLLVVLNSPEYYEPPPPPTPPPSPPKRQQTCGRCNKSYPATDKFCNWWGWRFGRTPPVVQKPMPFWAKSLVAITIAGVIVSVIISGLQDAPKPHVTPISALPPIHATTFPAEPVIANAAKPPSLNTPLDFKTWLVHRLQHSSPDEKKEVEWQMSQDKQDCDKYQYEAACARLHLYQEVKETAEAQGRNTTAVAIAEEPATKNVVPKKPFLTTPLAVRQDDTDHVTSAEPKQLPSETNATIDNLPAVRIYFNSAQTGGVVGDLSANERVRAIKMVCTELCYMDARYRSFAYLIETQDGRRGWVSDSCLTTDDGVFCNTSGCRHQKVE